MRQQGERPAERPVPQLAQATAALLLGPLVATLTVHDQLAVRDFDRDVLCDVQPG